MGSRNAINLARTFLVVLSACTALAATRADYVDKDAAVAVSPEVWHQFMRDAVQGDNAACQQLVDQHLAILVTTPVKVFTVHVEGDMVSVRLEGSNAELWTSVASVKLGDPPGQATSLPSALPPPETKEVPIDLNQDFVLGGFGFRILSIESMDRIQAGIETVRIPGDKRIVLITYGFWTTGKQTVLVGGAGQMRLRGPDETIYTPDADLMQTMGYDKYDQLKVGVKYLERKIFLVPVDLINSLKLEVPEWGEYFDAHHLAWMKVRYAGVKYQTYH